MEAALIAYALALGALLAVQAGANVQLAGAMASPVAASTTQVALAALALLALSALIGTLGALDLVASAEPWHLLGGLGTALYISAGILVVPRLGAVSAVGLFVAGQMLASLPVDAFGLLGVPERAPGVAGAAGGVAVLAGAGLVIRAGAPPGRGAGWAALALAAGAGLALQGPVNAQLRADLDAPVTAGAFSFLVATATMLVVFAVWQAGTGARRPRVPARRPDDPEGGMPWWGWLGALVGATYVTTVPLLIPEIGAAATIGLTVAGQQLASLAVDHHGLLRLPRRRLGATRIAGVALVLAGVVLIRS
jgi:bacterial/archaeal transporter family-2 protein